MDKDSALPSLYKGLSNSAKLAVLGLAGAIALANLLVAWYLSNQALGVLQLGTADLQPFIAGIKGFDGHLSDAARHDLLARAMHVVALTKVISNKQGIILACFGGAFALAAMGFALFVIGADGAFQVHASTADRAKIVLSGTAPGLLCFMLATWLVVTGVQDKQTIDLPPFYLGGATGSSSGANAQDCQYQFDGRCFTQEGYENFRKGQGQ